MRQLPFLVLALALLASGCLGNGSAPTKVTKASVDAAGTPPSATPPTGEAASNNTVVMRPSVMISYKGTSPTGACVYGSGTPADQCDFAQPGSQSYHAIDYNGKANHIAIKITYGAQQPGMTFYATVCTGKTADQSSTVCKDYKTGPSGFIIEQHLMDLPAGAALAIQVGSVQATPSPAGALVFASADFSVEGALTVV